MEDLDDFIAATDSYSLGGYDLDIMFEKKQTERRLKNEPQDTSLEKKEALRRSLSVKIHDNIDLSAHLSPPMSQGLYGSCYAFSIQSLVETALYNAGEVNDAKIGVSPQLIINCAQASKKALLPLGANTFEEAMNVLTNIGYLTLKDMEYKGPVGSCPKKAKKKGEFKFEIRTAENWKYPDNLQEEHDGFASQSIKYAEVMQTNEKIEKFAGNSLKYQTGLINTLTIKKNLVEGNAIATHVNIGKSFKLFSKGDAYPAHLCQSKDTNHAIDVIGFSQIRRVWKIRDSWINHLKGKGAESEDIEIPWRTNFFKDDKQYCFCGGKGEHCGIMVITIDKK